jgi:hypothetical protein
MLVPLFGQLAMDTISHQASEQFSRALGDAVVRTWGQLPQDVQHRLFEAVISVHGAAMRPQLAVFLHNKHPRTCSSIIAGAMLEPDSLGG